MENRLAHLNHVLGALQLSPLDLSGQPSRANAQRRLTHYALYLAQVTAIGNCYPFHWSDVDCVKSDKLNPDLEQLAAILQVDAIPSTDIRLKCAVGARLNQLCDLLQVPQDCQLDRVEYVQLVAARHFVIFDSGYTDSQARAILSGFTRLTQYWDETTPLVRRLAKMRPPC